MISPFTKPGTKVVCISSGSLVHRGNMSIRPHWIKVGKAYTVVEVVEHPSTKSGFVVALEESPVAYYGLHLFRYLELPKSITDCLNVAPVDRERLTERV